MNSTDIHLISVKLIKQYSPLMQNVDDDMVKMHISESQDIDMRYLLGESLYKVIFDEYEAYIAAGGTSAPNPKDTYIEQRILDLREQLKPYLIYRTLFNSTYSIAVKLTNKGMTEQSSDYSKNAELGLIEKMKQQWKTKSEDYMNIVIKYLIENNSLYPEYSVTCDNGEISSFDNGGLYLGPEL